MAKRENRPSSRTWVSSRGYLMVYAPKHPNANRNGAMLAHRYVASEALGRPLEPYERVHHKLPGRRAEWPTPSELEIWVTAHPSERVADIAAHAGQQLAADLRRRRDRRTTRELRRHPLGPLELADVDRSAFGFTEYDLREALRRSDT